MVDFQEIINRAIEVKEKYDQFNSVKGNKKWELAEYSQGFVGDVGDLVKLIMAKNGYRQKEDIDEKIAHELGDCLWSIIVIAKELDINLEDKFLENMEILESKIKTS